MSDGDTLTTGWFVALGDKREGPLSEEQVRSLISSGRIDRRTLVWRQGFSDWVPISWVPLFSKALEAPPPPPLPGFNRASNAFIASTIVWGIQLLAALLGMIALPREVAGFFMVLILIYVGISGILLVWYLTKSNIARVFAIAGSVFGILVEFPSALLRWSLREDSVLTVAILLAEMLLNIVFLWLAVVAKPVFEYKRRTP